MFGASQGIEVGVAVLKGFMPTIGADTWDEVRTAKTEQVWT